MKRVMTILTLLLAALFSTPLSAQTTAVLASGDTIGYMSYGEGSPTLLLVHGWSNSRSLWEPHIPGLSSHYRVVTLDLASFGESTSHRSDWSMRSFAGDIEAVLEELGSDQVVVVGFSMGGAVAIETAALGRSDVIGVILIDILQNVNMNPSDEFIDSFEHDTRNGWGDPSWVRSVGFTENSSETLVRRYLNMTPETVPDAWWASMRSFFVWTRDDMRNTLTRVRVPIAAINSDQTPTDVEAWQNYAPGFSVHVLEGVGHLGAVWERVNEFDREVIRLVESFTASRDN
jgi:pimeloyl-ACP methyl ester carboxylesterase